MINPIGFSFNKELSPIRREDPRPHLTTWEVSNLSPNIEKAFQYIDNFLFEK
jgi:hypothetical protein